MSDIKGKNAQVSVTRVRTNDTTSSASRKLSANAVENRVGHHSVKRRAKDVAAGLGLAYGAVTAGPSMLAGLACSFCATPPAMAFSVGEAVCSHEPAHVTQRLPKEVNRAMARGAKVFGGGYIVEPSLRHFTNGRSPEKHSDRSKQPLFQELLCPWIVPEENVKRINAGREKYRKERRSTLA